MDKVGKLIMELRGNFRCGELSSTAFERIVAPYLQKPVKRIPARRERPRVERDRAPRPKPPALIIYPDGREVCNQKTREGRLLYTQRTFEMAERQGNNCAQCGTSFQLAEAADSACDYFARKYQLCSPPAGGVGRLPAGTATFDHQAGRTSGHKDERIWTADGQPQNAALCVRCNNERGSTRAPYRYQTKITRNEWEQWKAQ